MKQDVLEKRRRILGDEHPDTISAMNNLANTLGDQGRLDKASTLFKEAYQRSVSTLGQSHPRTEIIKRNIIKVHASMSNHKEEKCLLKSIRNRIQRHLGKS